MSEKQVSAAPTWRFDFDDEILAGIDRLFEEACDLSPLSTVSTELTRVAADQYPGYIIRWDLDVLRRYLWTLPGARDALLWLPSVTGLVTVDAYLKALASPGADTALPPARFTKWISHATYKVNDDARALLGQYPPFLLENEFGRAGPIEVSRTHRRLFRDAFRYRPVLENVRFSFGADFPVDGLPPTELIYGQTLAAELADRLLTVSTPYPRNGDGILVVHCNDAASALYHVAANEAVKASGEDLGRAFDQAFYDKRSLSTIPRELTAALDWEQGSSARTTAKRWLRNGMIDPAWAVGDDQVASAERQVKSYRKRLRARGYTPPDKSKE